MGGSSYSDDYYRARSNARADAGIGTFDYSHKVSTGVVAAKVHDALNIHSKIRESRDSDAHPESLAVAVIFDVTGSMGGVPKVMQTKIPQLMGLLLRKGYVAHPQVLFGAVGDFFSDKMPIQIGQFESGAEMDDDINNIVLEAGGGGTYEESYQNAIWYFGNRTSIDCFEKRGHKGYLFIIGDEMPYKLVTKAEAETLMGVSLQGDVSVMDAIRAAQEKYNVFFVIPAQGTSHGKDPKLKARWTELLGSQNVIVLENNDAVCEVIATTIGIFEGAIDADGIKRDLADVGSAHVADAVTTALAPIANAAALARAGEGNLPERAGSSGTARL